MDASNKAVVSFVVLWVGYVFGEKYVSTSAAAFFSLVVEPCIGVGGEDHVAGAVCDTIVGIGSTVVKELVDVDGVSSGSGFSGTGLLRADGAEGNKELVVNGTGVVEEPSSGRAGLTCASWLDVP